MTNLERIQEVYLYFERLGMGSHAVILEEMAKQDNL